MKHIKKFNESKNGDSPLWIKYEKFADYLTDCKYEVENEWVKPVCTKAEEIVFRLLYDLNGRKNMEISVDNTDDDVREEIIQK